MPSRFILSRVFQSRFSSVLGLSGCLLALAACHASTPGSEGPSYSSQTGASAAPVTATWTVQARQTLAVMAARPSHATTREALSTIAAVENRFHKAGFAMATVPERADYLAYVDYEERGARPEAISLNNAPADGVWAPSGLADGYQKHAFVPMRLDNSDPALRTVSLNIVKRRATAGRVDRLTSQGRLILAGEIVSAGADYSFAAISGCLMSAVLTELRRTQRGSRTVAMTMEDCP